MGYLKTGGGGGGGGSSEPPEPPLDPPTAQSTAIRAMSRRSVNLATFFPGQA